MDKKQKDLERRMIKEVIVGIIPNAQSVQENRCTHSNSHYYLAFHPNKRYGDGWKINLHNRCALPQPNDLTDEQANLIILALRNLRTTGKLTYNCRIEHSFDGTKHKFDHF